MNLVVSNQKSPEKNDKLYNEFDHIKDSLNELKSLKQEIDFFDNEKKDLQKEVLEQKSKEIEQKKLDFENKKKEVEESIKEADELLKQEKTIDEKLIWLEEKVALEAELLTYKKELENLKLEVWFWWKLKETWNNVWEYAKENPGKTALIATGVGLAIWGISKLFKKKEKKEGDNESWKKPWYKRWYAWAWIGVAWFLWWKYRGDIKNLWNSLWGKETDQKDKFWREIATSLGNDRSYNDASNSFTYKSKKYTWEQFYKENLIHTKMDVDGKLVLDVDKTTKAIKEYVEKDTSTLASKHDIVDFEKYKESWNKLNDIEKTKYTNLDGQISNFYNNFYNDDNLKFWSNQYGLDKWFLLYHFDESFGNIWTLLNENTFGLFLNSSTKTMIESIFQYFPDFIISAFLWAAKGMDFVWLEQMAQDSFDLWDYLKNLKPTEITKLNDLCVYFYHQSTSVAYYALIVRDSYEEKVWWDAKKMDEFDQQKKLKDLDLISISDQNLKDSVENPKIDRSLDKKVEKLDSRKNKLIERLDKASTTEQQRKVMEKLMDEIDDVWYNVWYGSFALVWWHVFETSKYVDYDIISQMYNEQFAGIRSELKDLLKKEPLTDDDKEKIKEHIEDFYSTVKLINTQTKLRQETDEDWNLFTVWQFPVVRWWKTIYQTFSLYMEEGQRVLAWWTVLAAAFVWDMLTWPARKVLAMRKLLIWKPPIIRLSPTDFVVRKLFKGTLTLLGIGGEMAMREPTRIMSQRINKSKIIRTITFRTPESLLSAIDKWHIRLQDAAEMLTGKSSFKRFWVDLGEFAWKKWRTMGFSNDVNNNMMKLLENNEWIRNNLGPYDATKDVVKKQYETLAKYRDTKSVRVAYKKWLPKDKLIKLLSDLDSGKIVGWFDSNRKNLETKKNFSTPEKLSNEILESKKNIEKITQETFKSFEEELANEASKKWFKKWTLEYKKLSETIWNTSDSYWPKLEKLIASNNEIIMKAEETLMKQFNKASWAKKQLLYASDDVVKNIVNANWWLEKWRIPAFGRTWRIVSIWIHAVMLWWIGSGKDEDWKEKDWWTIWWEAADFGLGMIPVAWWLYDIWMAFRGKDLNGRQMWTGERWIRWAVWLWTWVLDVFTLWLWGTAIRAGIKWWAKVALKVWTKAVAKEVWEKVITKWAEKLLVEGWTSIASKWVAVWAAKQLFKATGRNIIIWTVAWIALVPVVGWIREVIFDDSDVDDNHLDDLDSDIDLDGDLD